MIRSLGRLLLAAGWAPAAVLVIHAIVAKTPYRQPLDFPMHFAGGAAIAYFIFFALKLLPQVFGAPSTFGKYLFSYGLACTVGLFWEFGEAISDVLLRTHIQQSLYETMSDLVADATGAVAALALVRLWLKSRSPLVKDSPAAGSTPPGGERPSR
jgi:hypothetical protein